MLSPLARTLTPLGSARKAASAPAWSPSDATQPLALWLRGAAGAYQDTAASTPCATSGDPFRRWNDQSGNGYAALFNAGSPTYNPSSINGKPGLHCPPGQLVIASFVLAQPFTVYIAQKFLSSPAGAEWDYFGQDTSGHVDLVGVFGGKYYLQSGGLFPQFNSDSDTAPHILKAVFSGSSSVFSFDGGADQPASLGTDALSALGIGGYTPAGAQGLMEFAEIIIYQGAIPSTDPTDALAKSYLDGLYATY